MEWQISIERVKAYVEETVITVYAATKEEAIAQARSDVDEVDFQQDAGSPIIIHTSYKVV